MNTSTSKIHHKIQIASVAKQHQDESQQKAMSTPSTVNASRGKEPAPEYAPDSLWSNLRYGLGMAAVIVIPPLIPGITTRGVILGYTSTAVTIYIMACIIKIVIILRPPEAQKSGRRRKHN